eukprot:6308430-Pyramimonas_sp.AAC.1
MGQLLCSVRNGYHHRSGSSPLQRAFEFTQRLPAALFSDDSIDTCLPIWYHIFAKRKNYAEPL